MNLFDFTDYRVALKHLLQVKKQQIGQRFNYQNLAKACGIQKTYLSRSLNSEGTHLSDEQLYRAGKFLGLTKAERDFLELLRRLSRTQDIALSDEIKLEIDLLRRKSSRTDHYISTAAELNLSNEWASYFLDPHAMLVHIFLTLERFRKNIDLIAQALHIPKTKLDRILADLQSKKLISFNESGYKVLVRNIHLPTDSPFYRSFRTAKKLVAIEQLARLPEEKAYSFSVAISSTPEVRAKILRSILELIQNAENLVKDSDEVEVYQLSLDLFDWT